MIDRRQALALMLAAAPALAHGQDKGARKKGGGASFIQLDPVTATIIRADGTHGVLTVELGVDVPDAALHARAESSIPLLSAAFGEMVRTYAAGLGPKAVPNVDYISMQLQRQTDQTLGRPGARLLLGNVLMN
ncbi:MAG TPA: Tat pathway signal protein [Caulobacteraceae bacterium]|jgi:hypothetical protein